MDHDSPEPAPTKDLRAAMDLFVEIFDLPKPERSRILDARCRDNDHLRRAVDNLLQHHDTPDTLVFTAQHYPPVASLGIAPARSNPASTNPTRTTPAGGEAHASRPFPWRRSLVAVAGAAIAGALAWLAWSSWQIHRERQRAQHAIAEAARVLATSPANCMRHLQTVPVQQRDSEWQRLRQSIDPVLHCKPIPNGGREGDVAFLPDGTPCIALAVGHVITLHDPERAAPRLRLQADAEVRWPRFAPDGRSLCAWVTTPASDRAAVVQWSLATGARMAQRAVPPAEPLAFRFGEDATRVLWADNAHAMQLDIPTGTIERLGSHDTSQSARATSRSRAMHLQFDEPGALWIEGQPRPRHLEECGNELRFAAFSADETWLATAGCDELLRIFRVAPPHGVRILARSAHRVALDASGGRLLALNEHEAALLDLR